MIPPGLKNLNDAFKKQEVGGMIFTIKQKVRSSGGRIFSCIVGWALLPIYRE